MTCVALSAQLTLSERNHDFGLVEENTKLWFDLVVENKGDQALRLLRVANTDNEFAFKFSNNDIPAHGSIDVRVQFTPLEKGKRNINLTFFFTKGTIDFKIFANVKNLQRDYTPCPDFDKPADIAKFFDTTFRVYDAQTGDKISYITDKNGMVEEKVPLAFYIMKVSAENYLSEGTASFVNSKLNVFDFYLSPIEDTVVEEIPIEITMEDNEVVEEETIVVVSEDIIPEIEESTEIIEEVDLLENDNQEFSKKEYVANNIVFLMDVSTSMKKEERLVMLKQALHALSDMLRDNDVVSLITYASTTNVLAQGHHMNDKQTIKAIITKIDGKGTTAGGKGIKKAYALANKYKIEGGNNHIYIATDGAFNKNDESLTKTISRQAEKDIYLSVIALKASDFATKKMLELTEAGKGDFIDVQAIERMENELKLLVKKQSKIKK
jgi:Mg-chelatase subunit ChlD